MASPSQILSNALEARSRASNALRAANRDLAQAIRLAQAQGLKGQALANELGMSRAGVSAHLKRYPATETCPTCGKPMARVGSWMQCPNGHSWIPTAWGGKQYI